MKLQRHHSSERDGRRLGQARVGSLEPPAVIKGLANAVDESKDVVERPENVVEEPMKCVWSGYPDYNRDCRSRIPASVVIKAWHREIQLKSTVEGFFYFSWRNGVWLAYGLRDGGVRGVYCPTHCVDRDLRGAREEDLPSGAPSPAPEADPPSAASTDPPVPDVVGSSVDGASRATRLGVALR
jgi:hypothetical protein